MATFETPVQVEHMATATLHFDYTIDAEHSGSLTIQLSQPYENNDEIPVGSLIAAIDASAEWTFTGGGRNWPTNQAIAP